MILVKEGSYLPSGSVYFAVRRKKEWQNSLSKAFSVDDNTDTTSLDVNVAVQFAQIFKIFARKNGQFSIVGDATASLDVLGCFPVVFYYVSLPLLPRIYINL